MAAFGALVLVLLLGIPVALLNGWALSVIWGWFIVPLGVPAIGVVNAIGIYYVVTLFTRMGEKHEEDKKFVEVMGESIGFIIQRSVVVLGLLGLAYLWHLFL